MREIKFRLWDKRDNKMRYQLDSIRFDTTDNLPFSVSIPSGARNSRLVNDTWIEDDGTYVPNENKEAELMQYTGLKDCNGKEIYEGDVLKGHYWMNQKKCRIIGKVIYGGHSFVLKGVKQYLGMSSDFNSLFEVIGNIYENPELMKSRHLLSFIVNVGARWSKR